MTEATILVIDDSATIRRLVDSELGNAGYRVLMAPTAEQGIETATAELPDMILLDHQLPGATGYEVCCQLLEIPQVERIPVVVSSTLRKKAYAEYMDCANVIDMLPKPYTGDLLRTTVANAIQTANMVVQSQTQGSAVPEVIDQQASAALEGSFHCFSLRELVDFLNLGEKRGRLEIELDRSRVSIFVGSGRVQGITASGLNPESISQQLPESIVDLAPMIKFTLQGREGNEVKGIAELLDNKVLDSRLLRQLLRYQSCMLLYKCLTEPLLAFRFEQDQRPPSLFAKLPLDVSLLALTVEASLLAGFPQTEEISGEQPPVYVKSDKRGQNLDRAGLTATQMKILNLTASPMTAEQVAQQTSLPVDTAQRILEGMCYGDMLMRQASHNLHNVLMVTRSPERTRQVSTFFNLHASEFNGRCVRDRISVKLLTRRLNPHVLVFDLDDPDTHQTLQQLQEEANPILAAARWIGLANDPAVAHAASEEFPILRWPDDPAQLRELFTSRDPSDERPTPVTAQPPSPPAPAPVPNFS